MNIEELDKIKSKVLKYIMYKKRTEQEIWTKFRDIDEEILSNIIKDLKEKDYINDKRYIDRAIKEFISLKNLSIKELKYKLLRKGIKTSLLEEYIQNNYEEVNNYEKQSVKNIFIKKEQFMEKDDIIQMLIKKGYKLENIDL